MAMTRLDSGRLSHAYIISAPSEELALAEARHIAAAAVCSDAERAPCGECRNCRKAFAGIHPDIITVSRPVDDKGRPKREIGVDQIRAVNADACVLPNEAARKVYIIDGADAMNTSAQNAALKLLEEPPAGALFLLCATNAGLLLPTVRSRCSEINLSGEEAPENKESRKLASEYIKAVASGDRAELCRWCASQDGLDGRTAGDFIDAVCSLTADMLCLRRDSLGLSARELTRITALAARCRSYLKVNVGVKHIFGLLAVDSIAGGGNRGKNFG